MSENKNNPIVNIDFKALSELGIHVLDKLEKACGFIYNPKGTEQEAIDRFIEKVKTSNLSVNEETALIFSARSQVKRFSRKKSIVTSALKHIEENNNSISEDDIDEEWCSIFFDKAQHVCSEEMQELWGRILAGELSAPGSIPKQLLHIMSTLEKDQAKVFSLLCAYSVRIGGAPYSLCNFIKEPIFWKSQKIDLYNISDLVSTGLISFSNTGYDFGITIPTKSVGIKTPLGDSLELRAKGNTISKLPIGDVSFTRSGIALCNLISGLKHDVDVSIDFFIDYYRNRGFDVKVIKN